MRIYVGGKKMNIAPAQAIGKGGEADIYDLGNGQALKVFKSPTHADFLGQPAAQRAAETRLQVHQTKLKEFPKGLPSRVVAPLDIATDGSKKNIVGYAMRFVRGGEHFLRLAEPLFRQTECDGARVTRLFSDLHLTVEVLHREGVVIGDFNDLNILAVDDAAYVIDADSFQFGNFPCTVFTGRFVDPTLCRAGASAPELVKPHTAESDWYAFAVMLFQSLFFIGPWDGVFKPKDAARRVPQEARSLNRISVFDPEVRLPKSARPFETVPDELLDFFKNVFVCDRRWGFPRELLAGLRWTRCATCGLEHARQQCPKCTRLSLPAALPALVARGTVTAEEVFSTAGTIVDAALTNGTLVVRYFENGALRESGAFPPSRIFILDGSLMRRGTIAPERIGDVLEGQTRWWAGGTFGLGFYRAGELSVAFVFDVERGGLNDSVRLPKFRGQLVTADAVFSSNRGWFFTIERADGKEWRRCVAVRRDGVVEAVIEAEGEALDWMKNIHGGCAAGEFLLMPTDEGVVQVGIRDGDITVTKTFPDTEPFVEAESKLLAGRDGLYVVGRRTVRRLKIG
jgi:hypothetical protein